MNTETRIYRSSRFVVTVVLEGEHRCVAKVGSYLGPARGATEPKATATIEERR